MFLQSSFGTRPVWVFFLLISALSSLSAQTFGGVVALTASPSDIVLDESRTRLYLVSSAAGRVDSYNYTTKTISGSYRVGTFPLGAAMSMDNAYLYVTNTQSSTLSVIDLNAEAVIQTVSLPAKPEGVAVGADGRVLITTQGSGTGNTSNTLLIFDRNADQSSQLTAVISPPTISTPNPLPAVFVGRPATSFPGRLLRTPDGNFIVGMVAINQNVNTANTTLFVYEVASGVVLSNRTVTGQSTVLAMAPDGSKFMAGSTLYDMSTLNVTAQMNTANLPFLISTAATNPAFNLQTNFGGSVFTPDGSTLWSSFNTAVTGQRTLANVLYHADPANLGVSLGIRLPQSVLGKMVITSDGTEIFAVSESGLIDLPISKLYQNPIIQPETTQVFLAQDGCNTGISTASVRVTNIGGGTLTFSVPTVTTALIAQVTSGVAPATVNFVMDPGRSGVTRQAGTNLYTGAGTNSGTPIAVNLQSPQAINFPNALLVYMNFRQSDQRGIVYPRPVSLSTAQGLQDMVLDEPRGLLYVTNAGYNRIEVFDTKNQQFVNPIPVGQLPHAMAMSLDGSTLYVANTGGESISVLDLASQKITGQVQFPPIPRAGNQTALQPVAMAMGISGLQFLMSTGGATAASFWSLVGNQAVPVPANSVTPATITAPQYMIATPGGESVLALAGNGTAYLYDALAGAYTTSNLLYNQTPISYFAPLAAAPQGNFFVVSGLTVNSALTLIGGTERPGQTTVSPPTGPGQPPTQNTVSTGARNVSSVYAVDQNTFVRLTTPVRQTITSTTTDDTRPTLQQVDVRTGSLSVVGVAAENPVQQVFGTSRVNVPGRQMVVDSQGTAYLITLSGLTVIPLTQSGTSVRPQITNGAKGVVNSSDGSGTLRPGSFITINGANLASASSANSIPPPTVLGGSCVVFNDVPIPLLQTGAGQISAQLPATVRSGQNVVQVRSLATAQTSDPVVVTVQKAQ
jgi:YVTN family beta-propeller protein